MAIISDKNYIGEAKLTATGHKIMKKIFVIILFNILCLMACGVQSINVTPETLDLEVGKTELIDYIIEPAGISVNPYFSSSDETIAKVDNSGLIEGVAKGRATITVGAGDKRDTCEVQVLQKEAIFTITDKQQEYYSGLGYYGMVTIYFKVENTGNINIDYYKVYFKVTCKDGSTYTHWTNGSYLNIGKEVTDSKIIDTAGKQYSQVVVESYGFEL